MRARRATATRTVRPEGLEPRRVPAVPPARPPAEHQGLAAVREPPRSAAPQARATRPERAATADRGAGARVSAVRVSAEQQASALPPEPVACRARVRAGCRRAARESAGWRVPARAAAVR